MIDTPPPTSSRTARTAQSRTSYNPSCFPRNARITNLDLDITKKCNLRCVYCFKGDLAGMTRGTMPVAVARAAVDWLIDGSGGATYLNVNFLGGEPTLAWKSTIEELVPYAKRRAFAVGKTVQFGTTTNLTAITPEIVHFSAQWGMGWHLSIDGVPEIQLAQRLGGHVDLVARVEQAAKRILAYRGGFCARATFTPDYLDRLFDSYQYLRDLGFRNFGFACATQTLSERDARLWVEQNELIVDDVLARASGGVFLDYGLLTYVFKSLAGGPPPGTCGAGRGYLMIDQEGNIWPCHRWDGAAHDTKQEGQWCLGNIFQGTFNDKLHAELLGRQERLKVSKCATCDARRFCGHGCPAENLSETGSIAAPKDEYCQLIRGAARMLRVKYERCIKDGNANVLRYIDTLGETLPNKIGSR